MGGYGSGRRRRYDVMTTVESCRSLDALRWQKDGFLRPLYSTYGTVWAWTDSDTGEQLASIGFDTDCDETAGSVRIHYTITLRSSGEKIPMDYSVRLTTTRTPWHSLRWWFICPLTTNGRVCARRVRKLYFAPGARYYGCRHCYRLTYASCNESHKLDSFYRILAKDTGLNPALVKRMWNEK